MSIVGEPRQDEPRTEVAAGLRLLVAPRLRWAAAPLALVYLVLLGLQLPAVIRASNLDADAVSAHVIGELFGQAGPHASTVLGTFGWYATLLAELGTKWLPGHRYVWELMPYAMSLASVALVGWSVWRLAGRWAASISAVLLICTSPAMLLLLLSMTQHGPDWFCCALLGAFIVAIERHRPDPSARLMYSMSGVAVVVGVIVGVNAASDPLVVLAGVLPFGLALGVSHALAWRDQSRRSLQLGAVMLVTVVVTWVLTRALMSAWRVAPEVGLKLFTLGTARHIGKNVGLWLQGIPTLANGAFFGRNLSLGALLAVICAALSLVAVALVTRLGWQELRAGVERRRLQVDGEDSWPAPERLPFVVFWAASAVALTAFFVMSSYPVDVKADRYLAGVVYAAAALVPLVAAGRRWRELALTVGTCIFALSGIASLQLGLASQQRVPTTRVVNEVSAVASAHGLSFGYADYWDAAPITWLTDLRVRVYPVSVCDGRRRLCPFDLHVISSWYEPRGGTRSFLLIDRRERKVAGPAPDLGPPSAVYRIGPVTMYVYPYDIANRFDTSYEQWRHPAS